MILGIVPDFLLFDAAAILVENQNIFLIGIVVPLEQAKRFVLPVLETRLTIDGL
jgi:hypothetical protein